MTAMLHGSEQYAGVPKHIMHIHISVDSIIALGICISCNIYETKPQNPHPGDCPEYDEIIYGNLGIEIPK
jgi:hypothetical protein